MREVKKFCADVHEGEGKEDGARRHEDSQSHEEGGVRGMGELLSEWMRSDLSGVA